MRAVCERLTGYEPQTCPWRALADPLVIDVVTLWRDAQTGMGVHRASALALDPPIRVWEGLRFYDDAFNRIKAHDRDLEEKNRKNNPQVSNG